MRTSSKGAVYLAHSENPVKTRTNTRSPLRVLIIGLLSMVTMFLSVPFISDMNQDNPKQASALRIACDDKLGTNMSGQKAWSVPLVNSGFPAEDKNNRRVTAQEAFGWGTTWVSYKGETDEEENDSWTNKEARDVDIVALTADNEDGNGGKDAAERIYDERTLPNCWFGSLVLQGANSVLLWSQLITAVTSGFTTFAFSSNIVCDSPDEAGDLTEGCVDLLFIIGGDGGGTGNDGIVGALTQSIYMPLLVLIALMVGVFVFWRGIVQRKLREGLFGALWAVMAVIIGLALLLNPAMLTKAPAAINNTLAGCVISAFGGSNCVGGSAENITGDADSSKVCLADANTSDPSESMELISASLTCSIWKAFVLEPYAQASFGTNFTNLDTNSGRGKELATQAGRDPSEFCVNMVSQTPIGPQKGKTLNLTGGNQRVCNIALYQLSLMTTVKAPTGPDNIESGAQFVDKRWYKIIDVASTNEATWNTWAGGTGSAFGKLGTAWIALFASLAGGLVLTIIAIFAILFYLSSIFLIAFAPIFFLIGVHPGKGRDILKGYGEMVLSNIFKYVASALFLIIALALYGGVLGASTSPGMTLLLVIIISIALFLYRRELVDLIGTVNMGGVQAGKSMSDKISGKIGLGPNSDLSRMSKTVAGSVIGAKLAGGTATAGFAEGTMRELKRGGGILGRVGSGAAMGFDMVAADNRSAITKENESKKQDAAGARDAADTSTSEYDVARDAYNKEAETLNEMNEKLKELQEAINGDKTRDAALNTIGASGASGRNFQLAMDAGKDMKVIERQIATGERKGLDMSDKRAQLEQAELRRNDLVSAIPKADLEKFNAEYSKATETLSGKVDEFRRLMADKPGAQKRVEDLQGVMDVKRTAAVETQRYADSLSADVSGAEAQFDSYRRNHGITGRNMDEIREAGTAAGAAEAKSRDIGRLGAELARGETTAQPIDIAPTAIEPQGEELKVRAQDSIPGFVLPEQPAQGTRPPAAPGLPVVQPERPAAVEELFVPTAVPLDIPGMGGPGVPLTAQAPSSDLVDTVRKQVLESLQPTIRQEIQGLIPEARDIAYYTTDQEQRMIETAESRQRELLEEGSISRDESSALSKLIEAAKFRNQARANQDDE